MRRLILATIAELKPDEHEIIELSLRHRLDDGELAAVLEVSWSRAHALSARARGHLERSLGALLIARTGRKACPALDALLADWDGRLTVQTGNLVNRHIEQCEVCAGHKHGALRPEVLSSLLPLAALPPGLREPILRRASADPDTMPARRGSAGPVGSPQLSGFPQVAGLLGWNRIRSNPGAATAVAAVAMWAVAALSATLITVTGMHAVRALAAQAHGGAASASTPAASGGAYPSAGGSSSPSPGHRSRPSRGELAPRIAPQVTVSPTKSAKATPTPSATASASASSSSSSPSPSPSPSPSASPSPSPTPTPTHSHTPTPTPSPSRSPSPSSSPSGA